MTPATFRLVILISLAHALVHMFELALPATEQMIGEDFGVGRDTTGLLGTVWRVPFGVGAFFAGWLADRFGSKPMLIIYLCGCAATALLVMISNSLNSLFVVMFAMGCFASIYHPAGLAFISRETTPATRPVALGWHGVLGSIGIASAPFFAGLVFSTGMVSWRQYYLILAVPAVILAGYLGLKLTEHRRPPLEVATDEHKLPSDEGRWGAYLILVFGGAMAGFIYAAFLHFLQRYLDQSEMRPDFISAESFRNYLATAVLMFATLGQAIAGRFARPGKLEIQLAVIMFLNVGPLLWMAFATGPARFAAACLFAFVHFMNQPLYNSLIAQYVPHHRRSIGYGFSNMACFSVGALGPAFAGHAKNDLTVYSGMAIFAVASGMAALMLRRISKRNDTEDTNP